LTKTLKIDFTNSATGFQQCRCFDADVVHLLRSWSGPKKLLVVLDRVHGVDNASVAFLVRDHLNLTGSNPLIGPNHPCGHRFTKVDDVYVTDLTTSLTSVTAAGLKPDVVPSSKEAEMLKSIGADGWCYNLVPSALVAAHAGFKVVGILLSEANTKLQPALEKLLTNLNGE
jgi:hypothetical protein